MLDYFRHPPLVPERPESIPADDLTALRQKLLVKLAVVTRSLPPNAGVFRKLALLDEARAAIAPDGGGADFPSLRSPSIQSLMGIFGDEVGSPTPSGNAPAAPFPPEPNPERPEPSPNAQPFNHSENGPAQRNGRQKVAVA